jgi:predicted metal-dependent hydrolase
VLGKKYNLQKINSKKNKIDIIDNNIYLFIKNENKLKNEINKIYIKIAESDVRKRLKF